MQTKEILLIFVLYLSHNKSEQKHSANVQTSLLMNLLSVCLKTQHWLAEFNERICPSSLRSLCFSLWGIGDMQQNLDWYGYDIFGIFGVRGKGGTGHRTVLGGASFLHDGIYEQDTGKNVLNAQEGSQHLQQPQHLLSTYFSTLFKTWPKKARSCFLAVHFTKGNFVVNGLCTKLIFDEALLQKLLDSVNIFFPFSSPSCHN